jgi:hypothetical protein
MKSCVKRILQSGAKVSDALQMQSIPINAFIEESTCTLFREIEVCYFTVFMLKGEGAVLPPRPHSTKLRLVTPHYQDLYTNLDTN